MTETYGRDHYQIASDKLTTEEIISECNKIFSFVADRLDKMEGFRGNPQFFDRVFSDYDIIITNSSKGLILKDTASPPNYWRVTIDSTGTLQKTSLGPSY